MATLGIFQIGHSPQRTAHEERKTPAASGTPPLTPLTTSTTPSDSPSSSSRLSTASGSRSGTQGRKRQTGTRQSKSAARPKIRAAAAAIDDDDEDPQETTQRPDEESPKRQRRASYTPSSCLDKNPQTTQIMIMQFRNSINMHLLCVCLYLTMCLVLQVESCKTFGVLFNSWNESAQAPQYSQLRTGAIPNLDGSVGPKLTPTDLEQAQDYLLTLNELSNKEHHAIDELYVSDLNNYAEMLNRKDLTEAEIKVKKNLESFNTIIRIISDINNVNYPKTAAIRMMAAAHIVDMVESLRQFQRRELRKGERGSFSLSSFSSSSSSSSSASSVGTITIPAVALPVFNLVSAESENIMHDGALRSEWSFFSLLNALDGQLRQHLCISECSIDDSLNSLNEGGDVNRGIFALDLVMSTLIKYMDSIKNILCENEEIFGNEGLKDARDAADLALKACGFFLGIFGKMNPELRILDDKRLGSEEEKSDYKLFTLINGFYTHSLNHLICPALRRLESAADMFRLMEIMKSRTVTGS